MIDSSIVRDEVVLWLVGGWVGVCKELSCPFGNWVTLYYIIGLRARSEGNSKTLELCS